MRTALNRTLSILPSLGSASSLSVTFSTETRAVPGYCSACFIIWAGPSAIFPPAVC